MQIGPIWTRLTGSLAKVKELVPANLANAMPAAPSAFVLNCEQIGAAFLIAALIGLVGRFLPYWVEGAALVAAAAATWWFFDFKYRVGAIALVASSAFYFFLGQPMVVIGGTAISAAILGITVAVRTEGGTGKKAALAIATTLGGTAVAIGVYALFYLFILPAVHPLTVWFYNISPAASVVTTLIVTGYASFRQPAGRGTLYWTATPILALLFCLYFWPSHSYFGMAVTAAVGLGLAGFAFYDRATEDKQHRSHRTFSVTAAVGVAFCAWFFIANNWTWLYNYQMANAISVTTISRLPATTNTRVVPLVAARDFCSQGNDRSFTDVGGDANPIVIQKDGEERMFWQCLRHPTRFAGHALLYATGGIEGVILADAGSKGRFGAPLDVDFLFGEQSIFTRGAFFARHPGSVAQPGLVGRTPDGEYYLLIPYVSKVPQWGGMVPELSGVMVVSQWGFIQDYTPAAAARAFPGVPLYPSALARQYAELWASESSLWAKHWSGDMLEVSEISQDNDNLYPFWESFTTGLKGVIPFEPVGKNQNALKAIGLIDPITGDMEIFHADVAEGKDISSPTQQTDLPGPKQIVANVSLSHPGLNQVRTVEALLVVSPSGHIYWLTSLLQGTTQQNHGYALNVLYDGHAGGHWDVNSTAEVNAIIAEREKGTATPAASAPVLVPAAPAKPDSAPKNN